MALKIGQGFYGEVSKQLVSLLCLPLHTPPPSLPVPLATQADMEGFLEWAYCDCQEAEDKGRCLQLRSDGELS